MKATSNLIMALTLIGIILLVSSIVVFNYPTFGLIVIAVMLVIFVWGQMRYSKTLKEIEKEEAALKKAESDLDSLNGESGVVATRIEMIKKSIANGINPDTQSLSEVLSARESAQTGRSVGGAVIILGLLGTFFGLTLVISNSAIALKPSNSTAEVISMILAIFDGMKGVFGTSLSGLVAALILNFSFSLVSSRQMNFMADVEEFTQFKLLPQFKVKGSDSIVQAVNSLENTMENFSSDLKSTMTNQSQMMLDSFSGAMKTVMDEFQSTFESSREKLNESIKSSGTELTKIQGDLAKDISEAAQSSQKETLDGVLASVDKFLAESKKMQTESLEKSLAAQTDSLTGVIESQKDFISEIANSQKSLVEKVSESQKDFVTQVQASQKESWTEISENQKENLDQVVNTQKEFVESVREKMETFYDKMSDYSTTINSTLEEASQENFKKLGDEFSSLAEIAKDSLENQVKLGDSLETRINKQVETLELFSSELSEAANLMKVNQADMQASLEMFNSGIQNLLTAIAADQGDEQSQQNFLDKLEGALSSFHERASEALVDNAMQTQEILLEVINRMNWNDVQSGGKA